MATLTSTMLKSGLSGAFLAALLMGLVATPGCVSQSYNLSGKQPYQDQMGAEYELTEDSYIVTLKNMDDLFLVNRYSTFGIPQPVEARFMGKATSDLIIKGIIRQGTVLKVAAIWGSQSFDAGRYVDFFLETGDEGLGLRIRVNACFLETNKRSIFQLNTKSFKLLSSPSPSRGEGRGEGGRAGGGKL